MSMLHVLSFDIEELDDLYDILSYLCHDSDGLYEYLRTTGRIGRTQESRDALDERIIILRKMIERHF